MNTNFNAKRVLIFGDSITWGRIANQTIRYDSKTRFTGILQDALGGSFEVIEEGLRGRMAFGQNPYSPNRNGFEQFSSIFLSHLPIDLLVIFLGTNDTNKASNKNSNQISTDLEKYIEASQDLSKSFSFQATKILYIVPPLINENYLKGETMFSGASERMKDLPKEMSKLAKENFIFVFDCNNFIKVCEEDGVHLNEESNRKLGIELASFIKGIIND